MKIISPRPKTLKLLYRFALAIRKIRRKKKCQAFGSFNNNEQKRIGLIYVINLDRQPYRWKQMKNELRYLLDFSGVEILNLTERYAAVDANNFLQNPSNNSEINPFYTLADQLFVEPQPLALPTRMELNSPIQMSRPEIAVALSHIGVWQQVIMSNHEYVLVLEDDVWFRPGFSQMLNKAWAEITSKSKSKSNFDILYLSYQEAKYGAPKTIISNNLFRPVRGLWHLSGYVVSREGAKKLLNLLPCRGPIDLWINHQFRFLNVLAIRRSVISQRRDISSTNSYSILPSLTKIGAITSESSSLFNVRPNEIPVFAFGSEGSGLSSLAMALSMLGYRCCNDLQTLPYHELELLFARRKSRVFDAYVNIAHLVGEILTLRKLYPKAKWIITAKKSEIANDSYLKLQKDLNGTDITILHLEASNKWQVICEHLRCAPPVCSYPDLPDLGHRKLLFRAFNGNEVLNCEIPKRDKSPWIVEQRKWWQGIHFESKEEIFTDTISVKNNECFECMDKSHWLPRNDTFTDNLALFRPYNIEFLSKFGAALSIRRDSLGVREYSAASLTSSNKYLFGRFEATIKVSKLPGVITGFFLHRDSPRQEIDIEISGKRTDRLLANVFYNPGNDGTKYDYGYRGSPSYISLGFDASESYHQYAIEWEPCEIRWFVDNQLVHRRVDWNPTPIPNLPMALHVNIWPCRSKELAGRLPDKFLPTTSFIKSISLEANQLRGSR